MVALLIAVGMILLGLVLVFFGDRIVDFNDRINKTIIGIRPSRYLKGMQRIAWKLMGVLSIIFGLWIMLSLFRKLSL